VKLGIIADTHDRLPFIDKAVQKLNRENVELVLHAGDYSAPFVTSRFKPLQAEMIGVFGNNDAEKSLLKQNFEAIGVQIRGKFAEIKADGLKIALLHGEEASLLESLINTGAYDVVLHGHTHKAGIRKQIKTLVVNPGEACGYLSERATFALLETGTMDVRFICIP
jgi:putative phosphoesterase